MEREGGGGEGEVVERGRHRTGGTWEGGTVGIRSVRTGYGHGRGYLLICFGVWCCFALMGRQ